MFGAAELSDDLVASAAGAVRIHEATVGMTHPKVARTLRRYAAVKLAKGDTETARRLAAEADSIESGD